MVVRRKENDWRCGNQYFGTQYGLEQILKEPTHVLSRHRSCVDFIFTDQPSLIIDFSIHLSLNENCYH